MGLWPTQRSHLSSGRINVDLLREDARRRLLEYLDKCSGPKTIIWDQTLLGPFGLIAEFLLLKEHGVSRIFVLRKGNFQRTDSENVIFLVRPKLPLMDMIADYVLAEIETKAPSKKDFHILFVSRRSFLCEKHLEERGVYANIVSIESYEVDLFPVDSDVLSMELDETFKECHLENDVTRMFHVARSLVTLQYMYGVIPNVYGKGKCAKLVFDLMTRIRREMSGSEPQITAQIHNVVLIDRSVDLLTPLATELTYEGLLDEIFGIRNNIVKVPPEKFTKPDEGGPQQISTQPHEILLNSAEALYADLRDKNFNAVGPTLSKKTKILSSQYEERHDAKSPKDLKEFVDKLPYMQLAKKSLGVHTSIAELIKERIDNNSFRETLQLEQEFMNGIDTDKVNTYIEDCIAREENIVKVLRLISMQSVVNGGLKQKVIDYYKREILQTYGHQHILSLNNLEKAQLLKLAGNKHYSIIKKTLKLIVEDVNEQNPVDISYVHSGYAPLSVRLVQFLANPGWRAITDILNLLPGPTVEEKQIIPPGLRKRRGSTSSIQSAAEEQKVTLVVFLGGCTFAEISALRFLSRQDDAPVDYIIATTSIINGNRFIQSLFEPLIPAGEGGEKGAAIHHF